LILIALYFLLYAIRQEVLFLGGKPMPRISILLSRDEEQALIQLALADLRVPNVEARFLLREELMRRGALKPRPVSVTDESAVAGRNSVTRDCAKQ